MKTSPKLYHDRYPLVSKVTTNPLLSPELKRDKIRFIQEVLTHPNGDPVVPHDAQMQILKSTESHIVVVAERQVGK
jgi:hypothetical protein